MTRKWEPVTLKLTAKQARVLWGIVAVSLSRGEGIEDRATTLRAIKTKLER